MVGKLKKKGYMPHREGDLKYKQAFSTRAESKRSARVLNVLALTWLLQLTKYKIVYNMCH